MIVARVMGGFFDDGGVVVATSIAILMTFMKMAFIVIGSCRLLSN